ISPLFPYTTLFRSRIIELSPPWEGIPPAQGCAPALQSSPSTPRGPRVDAQRPKAKGVVDIVFLLDATGSMQPCIDALKDNIAKFIDSLTEGGPNNQLPVRDWRGRVVGYRDLPADGDGWYVDNPFVRDPN